MNEAKKQYLETFVGIVLGEAKEFYESKFTELKKTNTRLETQLTFLKENPISKEEYIKEAERIAMGLIERKLGGPKTIPEPPECFSKTDLGIPTFAIRTTEKKSKMLGIPARTTKSPGHDNIMTPLEIAQAATHRLMQGSKNLKAAKLTERPEPDELLDDFVRKETKEEQEKRRKKLIEQSQALSKQLEEIEAEA